MQETAKLSQTETGITEDPFESNVDDDGTNTMK